MSTKKTSSLLLLVIFALVAVGSWYYFSNKQTDDAVATDEMSEAVTASYVDLEPRKWERPSDHTPVVSEFDW